MGSAADAAEEGDKKKVFNEFLKDEYNNIAQAHFDTSKSISEFFKGYIAIVSLPISGAVIFLKPEELKKSGVLDFLLAQPFIPLALLGAVMILGLFVLNVRERCENQNAEREHRRGCKKTGRHHIPLVRTVVFESPRP